MAKDFTRYWLGLVRDYTDDAAHKRDAGMDPDGIPPKVRDAMKRRGLVEVKKRVTITPQGREFLRGIL